MHSDSSMQLTTSLTFLVHLCIQGIVVDFWLQSRYSVRICLLRLLRFHNVRKIWSYNIYNHTGQNKRIYMFTFWREGPSPFPSLHNNNDHNNDYRQ